MLPRVARTPETLFIAAGAPPRHSTHTFRMRCDAANSHGVQRLVPAAQVKHLHTDRCGEEAAGGSPRASSAVGSHLRGAEHVRALGRNLTCAPRTRMHPLAGRCGRQRRATCGGCPRLLVGKPNLCPHALRHAQDECGLRQGFALQMVKHGI